MKNPKLKTKSIITQKEFEQGIWQFAVDHGYIKADGVYKITFYTDSKDDLIRRIYARASGVYQIKNENKVHRELKQKTDFYKTLKLQNDGIVASNKRVTELKDKSFVKWYIIIKLNQFRKYLIRKWIPNEKTQTNPQM